MTLWASFNRHLARVIAAAPEDVRTRPRHMHNLHQLAWKPVPAGEPVVATLEYFMRDYIAHLKHHFGQILGS